MEYFCIDVYRCCWEVTSKDLLKGNTAALACVCFGLHTPEHGQILVSPGGPAGGGCPNTNPVNYQNGCARGTPPPP